jgi:hypothetical protein
MPSDRIVIYTSIFGGYDGLLPQKKLPNVDFVCFTDRPVRASPWEVRRVEPNYSDPVRCAKEFKILPHRFFPDHTISIWIDGNFLAIGDVAALAETSLQSCGMAVFSHNVTGFDARDCIYEEYDSILRLGAASGRYKDDPQIMRQQIERYRSEGYPAKNGLISGGVLIRRHHAPDVVACMEAWWQEICNGSRRDQLSFNYTAWKKQFRFHTISGNIRDNLWFYYIGIHRASYRWKLLRYRMRRMLGLR